MFTLTRASGGNQFLFFVQTKGQSCRLLKTERKGSEEGPGKGQGCLSRGSENIHGSKMERLGFQSVPRGPWVLSLSINTGSN